MPGSAGLKKCTAELAATLAAARSGPDRIETDHDVTLKVFEIIRGWQNSMTDHSVRLMASIAERISIAFHQNAIPYRLRDRDLQSRERAS